MKRIRLKGKRFRVDFRVTAHFTDRTYANYIRLYRPSIEENLSKIIGSEIAAILQKHFGEAPPENSQYFI